MDTLTAEDLEFAAIACGRAAQLPQAEYMGVIAAKLLAEADCRRVAEASRHDPVLAGILERGWALVRGHAARDAC